MINAPTLKTRLLSFKNILPIKRPAFPLKTFSAWDIEPGERGFLDAVVKGVTTRVSVHRVKENGNIIGGVAIFPPVSPMIEEIGEENSRMGYIFSNGRETVCYDYYGGYPILFGRNESRSSGKMGLCPINFDELGGTELSVTVENGILRGNRFQALDEGNTVFRLTACEGRRTARIGFAVIPAVTVKAATRGRADFLLPVFNLSAFRTFDLRSARLVGLVERRCADMQD